MRRSTLLSPTRHGRHSSSLSCGRPMSTNVAAVAVAAAAHSLPARTSTPPPSKTLKQYRTGGSDTQWIDIFDGPMRPDVFVSPSGHTPTSTKSTSTPPSPISQKDNPDLKGKSVLRELPAPVMFDGPAKPRYILPGTYAQLTYIAGTKNRRGGATTIVRAEERSGSPLRSSLPAPTVYDGPAFEWETA